jgi:transglutaminase-like putative cysteine protease
VTLSVLAKALLWSLAVGFLGWSLWGMSAAVGGAVGAFAGVTLKNLPAVDFRRFSAPTTAVVLVAVSVCALFVPWLAAAALLPSVSLVAANALPAFLIACVVAWGASALAARFATLRILEMFFIAFAFAWPFLPASGGNHVRPQWLSDPALEQGLVLTDALSWMGWLGAILCLSVLLLSSTSKQVGRKKASGSSRFVPLFGAIGLLLMSLGAGWVASNYMAPVDAARVPPPPPPVSFAGDPPPPPPPEPLPVAAVQLENPYIPPSRLGAHLFRAPDPDSGGVAVDGNEKVLEAKIYYLDEDVAPLALAGPAAIQDIRSPNPRFKRAQVFRTRVLEQSDFSPSSVGDVVRLELAAFKPPTEPVPSEFAAIISSIDSIVRGEQGPPEGSRLADMASSSRVARQWDLSPSLQAAAIVDWLEHNGEFSAKSTAPEDAPGFIKSGLKGGSKHFANAAVALMQAGGITARVAEGYMVTAEKDPTDRIVITDGHKDAWPEVQLATGEWIPFPVRPKRVTDREEPPPREDAKDELFAAIEDEQLQPAATAPTQVESRSGSPLGLAILLLLGAVAVLMAFFAFKYLVAPSRRISGVSPSKQHRAALHEAGQLTATLIRPRRFGEPWENYSHSIGEGFPRAGAAMRRLLADHAIADEGGEVHGVWPVIYRRTASQIIFSRLTTLPTKQRTPNPILKTAQ